MELRVLQYFLTVANEESITRAAEVLHITQPTLSRQLGQLEEEMGVPLFRRGARKTALTQEGLLLKRRAGEILELAELTRRELRSQDQELEGTITIGSGELAGVQVLAEICTAFQQQYPRVRFDLFTATSDIIKERIEHGLADLGLCLEPLDYENFAFIRLPAKERWVAVLRPDDPLASKAALTPGDLAKRPLILPRRLKVQSELAHWFADAFQDLNIACTGDLITNMAILVQKGAGVALAVEGAAALWDAQRMVTRPLAPSLQHSVDLCWRKNAQGPIAEKFVAFAKCFLGMAEQ